MTPDDLDEIRNRITRSFLVVQQASGQGYETAYTAPASDFVTRFRAVGVKDPEQIKDEFLNLFVWIWSLKDYIKECYEAKGIPAEEVEEIANRSSSLKYVSDIANRAKHGTLRKSRSGEFAELVNVGFILHQDSIAGITVAGQEVTVHAKELQLIRIRALVRTRSGEELDAQSVLMDAISVWESQALARVEA